MLSWGRAGGGRDMWFHHPSQALPLTATVPRLPNGMKRKAGRAYRSVLDLVVAACTEALAGAMSVVPLDRRRTGQTISLIMRKMLIAISNSATISSEGLIAELHNVWSY